MASSDTSAKHISNVKSAEPFPGGETVSTLTISDLTKLIWTNFTEMQQCLMNNMSSTLVNMVKI